MICLLCHVIFGSYYRAELTLKYRRDVSAMNSIVPLGAHARNFDTGLFDCLQGEHFMRRNLHACCCTPVVYAVDASSTGFMSFWVALVITSIFLPLVWIFGFLARMHIRRTFKMQTNPIGDICAWCWCCSCALIQEHRFLQRVFDAARHKRTGAEITPLVPIAAAPNPTPSASQPTV